MRRLSRLIQAATVLLAAASCPGATQQTKATPRPAPSTPSRANADGWLDDFQRRIDQYMNLHKDAVSKSTSPKPTHDTAKIQAARETLAATIQSMRKDAKPGDIFTPTVRAKFRSYMYPEFKGKDGAETKIQMQEDAAEGVPIRVNAKYPEKAPVTTMAPNLLAQL